MLFLQQLVMYYQINTRSYLKEYMTEEQRNLVVCLFPAVPTNEKTLKQQFAQNYDPQNRFHLLYMRLRCFQACSPRILSLYSGLKIKHHPDLQPARFSTHFPNTCFMDLEVLLQWVNGECEYPSLEKQGHPEVPSMLDNYFEHYSFIPNLERFLLFYPTYLYKIEIEYSLLFNGIQIDIFHAYFCSIFIALEAGCSYLAARFANKFVNKGGNLQWLKDPATIPKQLEPILLIFRKFVRAPWYLDSDDFEFCEQSGFWTPVKVISYCELANYINTLATISLALGILPEEPCPFIKMEELEEVKRKYDNKVYESNPEKQKLAEEIKKSLEENPNLSKVELEELEKKQIAPYMKGIGSELKEQAIYEQFTKIMPEILPKHIKFPKGSNEISPMPIMQEKDYFEEVYRRLKEYKNDLVDNFYDRNNYVQILTFENFGSEKQNTEEFRKVIRQYCEKLLGYTKKHFDYRGKVRKNVKLTMPLRYYMRLLSLAPPYLKKQVLEEVNHESGKGWIEAFDLGHLAIIAAETKARCNMTTVLYNIIEL